jgi:FimV-like protein
MQRSFSHTLMALALAAASLQTLAAEPSAIAPSASASASQQAGTTLITAKDTLWDIAGRAVAGAQQGTISRNQAMVAILRRNPDAFVNGHLSRLRRGVALTLPTLADMQAENSAKASALVASQQGADSHSKLPPLYALQEAASSGPVVIAAAPTTKPASSASAPVALIKAPLVASAPASSAASAATSVTAAASTTAITVVAASAPHSASSVPAAAVAVASAPTDAGKRSGDDGNALAWTVGLIIVTLGAGVLVYALRRAPSEQVMAEAAAVTEAAATKRASLRAPTTISTAALDLAKQLELHQNAVLMVHKSGETSPAVPNVLAESALRLVLARAYLEIKDRDASRKQLEIVLRDGDEAQKEEAHGAMARL